MRQVAEEIMQFVPFEVAGGTTPLKMALNVQKIKEVVESGNLSPYPGTANHIVGIFDLRGHPVPVINILAFLGVQGLETEAKRILICDLQNLLIGIPVLNTGRIVNCPNKDFLPPPEVAEAAQARAVSGIIRQADGYIPLLDLDSFLHFVGLDAQPAQGEKPNLEALKGKRILVVEDSKIVLKKIVQLFERFELKVVTASNGEEAWGILSRPGAKPDLIFADIEMPVLDGISLARRIKESPELRRIPILFNSALSNPALIVDVEREQLGKYLVKFDEALILKHLAECA